MKKILVFLTLVLLIVTAVSGCAGTATVTGPTGSSSGNNGQLVVSATDAPPSQNVTAIIVTVASVKVHQAGPGEDTAIPTSDNESTPTMTSVNSTGSGSGAGGQWIDIPLDGEVTFDLLQVQGLLHYLGSANLTAGTYTQLRLQIDGVKVGLNGGEPQDATLPSGVLKVVRPFQIASDMTTSLTLDFVADRMVTVTGNGGVIVKPVVRLSVSPPSQPGQSGMATNPNPSTIASNTPATPTPSKPTDVPTPSNK